MFNCAAKVGDWGTLDEFRRLNVAALRLLLEAAADARLERFVHVSSLGVYEGRDHFGTDETVAPAARSLDAYTRSKVEAEVLALQYVNERNLPVSIVRPGFIYGPRDRTVLCAELPCAAGDAHWSMSDAALGALLVETLARIGLPLQATVLQVTTRRLPQAYPIYERGYEARFAAIDRWLGTLPGVLTLGRQGLFAHDNTHHTLAMAYAAVSCLDQAGRFDRARYLYFLHDVPPKKSVDDEPARPDADKCG